MSDYPTAEEELKAQTLRLWAQVDVTEQLIKERDELRTLARELRDALQDTLMVVAGYMKRSGAVDILEESRAAITKAKEVLP